MKECFGKGDFPSSSSSFFFDLDLGERDPKKEALFGGAHKRKSFQGSYGRNARVRSKGKGEKGGSPKNGISTALLKKRTREKRTRGAQRREYNTKAHSKDRRVKQPSKLLKKRFH